MLHGEGIGGVVFLILYLVNFSILVFGFSTGRISFKSVYSFLLFHVVLRLSAQSVAIAVGSQESLNTGLLVAFFVLGAEGYFSLVLCTYRFVIHHHEFAYPISGSWLEGKRSREKSQDTWYKRFQRAMTGRDASGNRDPWIMTIIHWTLIGANVIIVVGGARVSGINPNTDDYWNQLHTANILRAVGQAIFLAINFFLASFIWLTIRQDRNPSGTLPKGWPTLLGVQPDHGLADANARGGPASRRINSTMIILMVAWPALIIRGIFGLLQAVVPEVNYSDPKSFQVTSSGFGFTPLFIAMENVFAVLPEWTACCLLCMTMLTAEGNKRR